MKVIIGRQFPLLWQKVLKIIWMIDCFVSLVALIGWISFYWIIIIAPLLYLLHSAYKRKEPIYCLTWIYIHAFDLISVFLFFFSPQTFGEIEIDGLNITLGLLAILYDMFCIFAFYQASECFTYEYLKSLGEILITKK